MDSENSKSLALIYENDKQWSKSGSFFDGNKQSPSRNVVCPSNETCQYLYNCSHFQTSCPIDRREHVKNLKLCCNCFGSYHDQHCNSKIVCQTGSCGQKHHTLLHKTFGDNNQRVKPPSVVKFIQLHGTGQVALVPFELSNGVKTLDTYAYIDNGSCQSLLITSAASELEIDINTVAKIPVSGYQTTREIDCSQVFVQIKLYRSQNTSVVSMNVLAVPDLNMTPGKASEQNKLCSKFDHLKHITLPNVKQNQVCIIIGIDNLELIHYSEIVKGPKNTTWAVKTPLVWTCAGETSIIAEEQNPVLKTQICSNGQLGNKMFTKVQDCTKIRNYGTASKKKALSKNDEKALEILQSTTRFKVDHYKVGLLWKENAKLPNNNWLPEKQLK